MDDIAGHRPGASHRSSLLAIAGRAARAAGQILADGQRIQRSGLETKSSPTDMVSDMDRAAEAAIRSIVNRARPDDAVLGEEGGETSGTSGIRWIIDPLDGTTNYLYGLPAWSVSVAAEIGGATEVGVVFDPTRDELFAAQRNEGATCNDTPIQVTATGSLEMALVATGFAYARDRRAVQARWLQSVLPAVRDIRRAGSAALDLCSVGAGRLDAYYETGLQVWDWAAGALIAKEAGAWVGGLDEDHPSITGVLAATPALTEPLRVLLRDAGATTAGVNQP